MSLSSISRKLATAAVAISLCASPTMARAATATMVPAVQTISPLVALSAFGSQASAAALCGSTAVATAGAASAAQAQPGCVLPVVDVAAPPPVQAVPPAPPPPSGGFGFGISPIILGLLGIAALAALIALSDNDDDDDDEPVSPN